VKTNGDVYINVICNLQVCEDAESDLPGENPECKDRLGILCNFH